MQPEEPNIFLWSTQFEQTNASSTFDALKILEAQGVDFSRTDTDKYTALIYVVARSCEESIRYLIKKGISPDQPNEFGDVPLAFAVASGWSDMARLLIELGAKVSRVHDKGYTVLLSAAVEMLVEDGQAGSTEIFKLILSHTQMLDLSEEEQVKINELFGDHVEYRKFMSPEGLQAIEQFKSHQKALSTQKILQDETPSLGKFRSPMRL